MRTKADTGKIVEALKKAYPMSDCSLEYEGDKAWQLMVGVRLAAQCTDARVGHCVPRQARRLCILQSRETAEPARCEH